MKKPTLTITILLATAMALTACQQAAPAATPAPAAPTVAAPAASPPTPTEEAQNLELSNVGQGLSALDSYQITFGMSFEGKDKDGNPENSEFQSVEEFTKNPLAKRTTVTGQGAAGSGTDSTFQIVELDGKTYSVFGTTCAVSDADSAPEASSMIDPTDVIGNINTSQLLGVESVNGVQARHYSVDAVSLAALDNLTQVKAEAWIAGSPVEFVVKYVLEAQGSSNIFGASNDAEGTLRWEYQVDKINQPLNITPPENCSGEPEDIPIMNDAKDKSSFSGITSYTSPSAFADVVAFYKSEMPARGWTEDTSSGSFQSESFTTLVYDKDGRKANITITGDPSSGTSVLIQIGE